MKIIKLSKLKFSQEIEILPFEVKEDSVEVKFYSEGVQAGFPSPADDFKEEKLSLDKRYLSNPDSTYLIRVAGNSMVPTLEINDILVVRSDFELKDNCIVIVSVNNTEFTVKRYNEDNKELIADNPDFPNIKIGEDDTLICLGIVKNLIRDL